MLRIEPGARHRVTVTVNGRRYSGFAEARTLLSDFLRHELKLFGTHVGCEHGVCGACTVTIDGRAVRSCLHFAVQADGAEIGTVEGLATGRGTKPATGGVPPPSRAAMRLLHAGHPDFGDAVPGNQPGPDRRRGA